MHFSNVVQFDCCYCSQVISKNYYHFPLLATEFLCSVYVRDNKNGFINFFLSDKMVIQMTIVHLYDSLFFFLERRQRNEIKKMLLSVFWILRKRFNH